MLRKILYLLAIVLFVVSCGSTAKVDSDETVDLRVAIARSAADIIKKVPPNTTIAFFNISAGDYSGNAECQSPIAIPPIYKTKVVLCVYVY